MPRSLVAAAATTLLLSLSDMAHAGWNVESIYDGRTYSMGQIAVDAFGDVHVAYGGDNLYYARRTPTGWVAETVDGGPSTGNPLSLVLDSAGRVGVAYADAWGIWTGKRVLFARRGVSNWNTEEVDVVGSPGGEVAAAFGPTGLPVVAAMTSTGPPDLRFSAFDGSSWTTNQLATRKYYSGLSTVVDPSGVPWIAYTDEAGDLVIIHRPAGVWMQESIEVGANPGRSSAIALDLAGSPIVAYRHEPRAVLRLARRNAGTWSSEDVDISGSVGASPAIAVAASGEIHISHRDLGSTALRHSWWDGSSWRGENVTSGGAVGRTSIALDPSGRPWILYGNTADFDLMATYFDGSAWTSELVDRRSNHGRWPQLVFDPADQPILTQYPNYAETWLTQRVGGVWTEEWIDFGAAIYAGGLEMDPTNNLAVPSILVADSSCALTRHDGSAWTTGSVDPRSNFAGGFSLVFDSLGNAHLAYVDLNRGGVAYATDVGGTFRAELVEYIGPSNIYGEPTLRLNAAEQPMVAYARSYGGLYDEVHVATYNGSGWVIDVAIGPSANDHLSHTVAMALLPGDLPVIATHLEDSPNDLRVSSKASGTWVALPPPHVDVSYFGVQAQLDPTGNPAFVYALLAEGELLYSVWDGVQWDSHTLELDGVTFFDFILDRRGMPAVALFDEGNHALLLARMGVAYTLLRGTRKDLLTFYADATLPWVDPEPVLGGAAPPLYYYQADGVARISLAKSGTSVRVAPF